ncbi:filamentous hemagglutinin N-terminal domain-containing protein [Achromobacter insolitus]|uniref:Filamentous haemagglutinin FhaB/tRNA nuclease CdiA-like TPS domain-containing protein n=2 Tax=Achromobacter insolitus TaxID=217204 RepID=A0A6S7FHQ2_9BURK|nr:filamentous hemagglutinin N-terminal domain-containing protein [Achromobacter insolitus]CAB3937808.1 hypothetical protein LMG6000_05528 [Achromobacter insolitus]CAB3938209.1 hypothetical protein LMG5997_03569 [Achromobacter insolitus]
MTRNSRSLAKTARRLNMKKEAALPALSTLAVLIGSLASTGANANPTGGKVIAGSANISDRGNGTLDITQSTGKAIINWKDFSIGANETVNFRQPGSNSVTLNRVVGNDPSAIFGRLNANGTVMLVNPNGVVFGKGARVDVGGLVATTANINDKDFLAGNYKFNQPSSKRGAMIVNEGTISIKDSGLAALVAPAVRNSGVIEAKLGRVALAGAKTVTVDFHGDGLLSFDATSAVADLPKDADGKPVSALVANNGVIRADGGTVLMTARAVKGVIDNVVNTDGIVSAKSVGTQNGKIVLSGGDAGTVRIAGTVDATGTGTGERGGKVVVTGEHVNAARSAAIDVSGAAGGGEIALGSLGVTPDDGSAAFSGKSSTVKVAAGATLKADALVDGKGGNVTMWSNDATAFGGTLSARGGAQGGDGGFAEVSSNKNIGLTGTADLRAPKGKTGLLLIDPTDLRIVDAATGGSQDGNAGDGTINGGDANAANNTVSRGLLESLAGTTNIKLEATGQITVADMSAINLQTAAGHSFTMRSTQTGGIRFENANTEISTQGGSITLEALGVGSTLNNIGKLTSRGGAITLNATGDINLANIIDAGNGAALIRTSAGSIRNTGGANQVVAGRTVHLDASGGNIGDMAAPVNTQTSLLSLATGGNLAVANRQTLTTLDITSRHAQSGVNNSFQLTSPGLAFALQDNGGYQLNTISQSGLNFSFTGDRSITVADVALGTGTLTLASTAGDIFGTLGGLLNANQITLSASGSNGRNGAIGSSAQALRTQAAALTATSGSGGIYVNGLGSLNLKAIDTTGSLAVQITAQLTLGDIKAGGGAALTSMLGSILDDGNDATSISTSSLSLSAQQGIIGGSARALKTNASNLSATAGAGGVYLDSASTNLNITQAQANGGPIAITGAGSVSANNVGSGGGAINLTGNSIAAGQVNAGAGNVTLTARAGSITGSSASLITGNVVTLLAPASNTSYTVGTSGTYLRTAAGVLNATGASIYLNQAQGSVLLDDLKASNGIYVTGVANLSANMLDAGTGTLWLNAQGGSIVRANANSALAGNNVTLQAQQHIGTASDHLLTATTNLTLGSGGDIYVDNPGKTLTYLVISNSHADPARRNTLQIAAPFLNFDVNDDLGNAYELRQVYSSLLSQFSFTGDQSLKLGNIRAGSSIGLSSTLGSILDDGIVDTRVTANNVSLRAAQDIGTGSGFVGVNAQGLTLDTRGDLYVTDIADLFSLTVYARHKGADDRYALDVRAPSLLFNITDDVGGHTIHEVRDSNWVNFSFTGDRDITVGNIDAGYSGSIALTATGNILDDGNKQTRLLASSVNLMSSKGVGAAGTGHLDVLTGLLSGWAGDGGFYVQLPNPTGSSNTAGVVTLNNITASGDVQIEARQGDMLLANMVRSSFGSVALNAANGSLFGSGYGGVYAGGNNVSLRAAGAIGGMYGGNLNYVGVSGAGVVNVQALAGSDIYLNGTATGIQLTRVEAGMGQIGYLQSYGNTTLGDLRAGGAVTLNNSGGSLVDDGDAATIIRGSNIALTAGGAIGAPGAALALQAPDVSLASGAGIAVDNLAGLARLNITRNGTANGSYSITAPNLTAFTVTDDGLGIHLTDIASSSGLDFGFAADSKNLLVGNIDAGASGKVSLATGLSISNDNPASPGAIRASTVALTAGANGSIGSSIPGGALALTGASALNLTAGNNMNVGSDTVLRSLAINSLKNAGSATTFDITGGAGQVIRISDDGATQYLEQVTGGLTDFSFSGRKNIQVGTLTASNSISLTTANGGANSSITSDSGSGRIAAGSVTLSATGSDSYTARDANTGAIGASGRALRLSTSNLAITNNGDINLHNGGLTLNSLDLHLSRRDAYSVTNFDTNSYAFGGLGSQTLSISGGTTLAIGANMNGAALAVNTDTAIVSNTINTGGGSVSLTSRYANTDLSPSIGGSGLITGNNVSLSALGTNGSVSAQTSTANLAVASAGNVSVANNKQLGSLSLTANHSSTSGALTNTYNISASGMTAFSLSDSTGFAGLTLNNITNTGNLALSISSDRALTVNNVSTAAGGSVTLASNGTIYGNSFSASAPNITTGALTLNAGSVTGVYATGQPLFVSVDSLSSNIRGSLSVSNNKSLTLLDNSAAGSALVSVTNGSIMQGAGRYVAPVLTLTATQSIGAAGNAIQTDTRQLTTQSGGNLYVNNASDLFSLNITANHANSAVDNVLQVAAKGLTFNVADAGVYTMAQVSDLTGLNFSFTGDRTLYVGDVDVGAANTVSLGAYGAGAHILNLSPTSHVTGDVVTLGTSGQIGVASGDNSGSIHTTTSELYLTAGSHVYVDNDRDLASLYLYATGVAPATYQIQSNELKFDVAHNGSRLQVNEVRDDTGLNLTLSSNVGQDIGIIDTTPIGTVRLSSNNSILGSADDSQRISASQVSITTQGSGSIGAVGREINLSAPLLSIQNGGDVYIDSDTHIDALTLYSTGNSARSYGITSPTRDGGNIVFQAADGGSASSAGLVLTKVEDKGGLNLSVTSDRNITVGAVNVGYDNVVFYSRGSLLGDGDAASKIDAAALTLTATNAIGAAGAGNAIDTRVSTLSGRADNGGAFITVEGNTSLPSLTSRGASAVSNTVGDIELGTVNTNGNAFTVNNTGGSILSGTINNATTVDLTANGSIGNKSAIRTNALNGGTTTVTLSATKTDRADGSIALTETYGLQATAVTAPGNITLVADTANNGRNLTVGTITSTDGAVALSTSRGSITGINNSNLVTGKSVSLTANYGTAATIGGSNSARLHLNTEKLTMATPGSIYVDNLADLSDLTIIRNNAQGSNLGSGGFLTIDAQNLTFSGADTSNATALTIVRDTTGLNFTYQAVGAINIYDIDVTQNGSVTLSTNPYYYTGGSILGMNASAKIVAGDLALSTASGNTPNTIGSAGQTLNTQVKNITATASGGIWLKQTGSINLGNLRAGGDLSVTTTTGDIQVGTVSYGTGNALTLNAQTGSILHGGGTLSGAGGGPITLTARNGIGTRDAAIKIAAPNSPVSATVTGDGSLYLDSTGNLLGGLTTSVANGETRITGNGNLVLTSMTSGTDAVGNDISVKTSAGNITAKNVQAGANNGQVTLSAENGMILADSAGASVKAYGVSLNGAVGVGINAGNGRINATGQRVEVTTNGAMYLAADNNSVYSYLSGNIIDIAAAGNLQIANALSNNGTIKITGNGTNSQLVAGNIDAGAGAVNIDYSKAGSTIVDDREASTRIIGGTVALKAGAGIGGAAGSADKLQTTAASITAEVTGAGAIYLDDNRAAGTTLNSITTQNGAIGITTAGPTLVANAVSNTSSAGNNISIATSNGDLSINTIDAKQLGNVILDAAGSIRGALPGNLILGNGLSATAGGSIGSALNLADGSGGIALRTNLASLGNLATGGDGAVIVLDNVGTRKLTLSGNVAQTGEHSSAYLRTAGDLDAHAGLSSTADNLLLAAGGTLTVASGGVQANDTVTLTGGNDIVAYGSTPRTISVKADTLNFSSGAAGGNTTLTTQVGTANVRLNGTAAAANLTLNNTGALAALLDTANGNITASATGTLNVSATASGSNRSIDLSSQQGDVEIGTVNAGAANGTIILSAIQGSLAGLDGSLQANNLDLTSKNGIGAENAHFSTSARNLKANVLGTGDIFVDGTGSLTLGRIATADGNIAINANGDLTSAVGISAGNSGANGNVTLTADAGDAGISHAIANGDINGLAVNGTRISMAAANTAGRQAYTGDVTLNGDLTGSAIDITGNTTLAGGKRTLTANGDVSLSGLLNGAGQEAAIVSTGGHVTLGDNATNLTSLSVDGASIDLRQVATTGAQQYNGATTLRGTYTTNNGAFGVDGATVLGSGVTVSTGSGAVTFTGGMSGANALTVTSTGATTYGGAVDIASLNQAGTGVVAINGGMVTTSGAQDYSGHVQLGDDATLTGATLTLRNGADGAHGLEIDGTAALAGAIGANTRLASLTVVGPVTLNTSSISTTGNQHYKGAVTLGSDQSLSTTIGSVAFDNALDGARDLTVGSTSGGNISFGAVGGATRVNKLTANTSGTTAFNGAVRAASVQTDAPGSVIIESARIDTTGTQSYGERITLARNATLKGSNVTLNQGADSADETQSLTIDGNATINGAIGAGNNARLASLTITGAAELNGGAINTIGAQSYQGNITLSDDLSLATANGNVGFGGTVASAAGAGSNLTVGTGSGNVTFAGAVGDAGAARLGGLTVNSQGAATLDGAVYAASVTTDAGGTLAINGGRVDTTATQSYGELAVLGADTLLTGSKITLNQGADSTDETQDLTIGGNATINGAIGAGSNARLASLTITGAAELNGGAIDTVGAQSYQGNVTLSEDLEITTANGNVGFAGTVASASGAGSRLTVGTGNGNVTFAGAVGDAAAARLGDITINSHGATTLGGAIYATAVTTDGGGTLAVNGGRIDTTGTQSYGELATLGADTVLKGSTVTLSQGADSVNESQDLTIAGNAVIKGAVGAGGNARLASLTITGASELGGGAINTVGAQSYQGQATLTDGLDITTANGNVGFSGTVAGAGKQLTIDAGNGNVAFSGAVGAAAVRLGDITVNSDGATVLDGAVYAASVTTDADGTLAINGGRVDTTGTQSYGELAVLGAQTSLKGSNVTLNQGADSANETQGLTIDGNATINGAIGAGNNARLASLTITGAADLNGGVINTLGAQSYQGNVTLSDDLDLATANGAVGFGANVAGAGMQLTIGTGNGNVAFSGEVGAAAARLGDITVNSSGATMLDGAIYAASVTTDAGGSLAINGGRVDTTATQSYGELATLGADTLLKGSNVTLHQGAGSADESQSLTIDGNAAINGAIGTGSNARLASLTITGTANLDAGAIKTVGAQSYQGNVALSDDLGITTADGNVVFGGTVASAAGAGSSLTVGTGNGNVTFFGAVGAAAARLGDITVNSNGATALDGGVYAASVTTDAGGTLAINGGRVDTTGTQSYGELATLGADTVLKGSTVSLLGGADGTHALNIAGNAVINGALGANNRLASLAIGGNAELGGGAINTVGAQSYQGQVTLTDGLDITTANGNVGFSGTVAGAGKQLTIDAGNGNVAFSGAVGAAAARLGDITVNSNGATALDGAVYAASVTTDAGGTLAINGGRVDTTGAQSYAELAALGADTVLKGSTVSLLGGADGAHALNIAGNAVINGALGANNRLASLAIGGNAELGGGAIHTVGAQSYQGQVTLTDGLDITTANGNVGFSGTVAGAGKQLTIDAGNGNVAFSGAVGAAAARLGDITVNSNGATALDGAVYAASVTTDAGGTLAINGGRVDTSGTQSYGELAALGADTVLKGSTVSLLRGADGAHALNIAGNAVINGALGANNRLASLAIGGNAELGGGAIHTVGAQSYQGQVTLTDGLDITTANGNVGFSGTVAGAGKQLTIDAGNGNVAFSGAVGAAAARLGDITVNSNGATALDGAVYAASVTTDAGGTLAINGGRVDTSGTQSYGELAALGADTVLKGSTVSLLRGADGAHALNIAGNAVINGALGANNRLASLAIGGNAELGGGAIHTVGAQSYQGDVTLNASLQSDTANADVVFSGKVASAAGAGYGLAIDTGNGNVTFSGAVGDAGAARLGDIAVNSNGATVLDSPIYAASVTTSASGTLAINGSLVDTTGAQSYGELAKLGADTVLKGSNVSLLGGGDGSHGLTIDGDAVLKGPIGANEALASLTVTGNSKLGAGGIATSGDQSYQGAVILDGDSALTSRNGDIRFGDSVDGGHDLTASAAAGNVAFAGPVGQGTRLEHLRIHAAGDAVLNGPVRAASVQTSGQGDLLINGGSIDTTGAQQYGQHMVLGGADTTLSGTDIRLQAGVDGTDPGQQGLIIAGNADIQGDIGGTTPLRGLDIDGTTTMGSGKVVTTGDQTYAGAVTLTGDRQLSSSSGSVMLGSTLDGGNGNNLAISAGQNLQVAGNATGLGSLTLRAVDTIVLNGDVSAYRVQQLEAKSASYNGAVRASGPGGIDISGGNASFGKDVTAEAGAINIANTDAAGTTAFAAATTVKAATGFNQTGGAGLTLPAQLLVTQGPINLGAPAKLQGSTATISTNGNITAVGLSGPQTSLTLAAGPLGALRIGLNNAAANNKLDVADLSVPSAGSADIWGSIGGKTGALAASMVKSSLVGSPYFLNGATWGPTGVINRLSSVTAPSQIIPTTPTADPLFRGTVAPEGYGPDALDAYTDPQVLKVASAGFSWQLPSFNHHPQQSAVEDNKVLDDKRRDDDAQSRTL